MPPRTARWGREANAAGRISAKSRRIDGTGAAARARRRRMMLQMVFESVNGYPVPVVGPDPEPDGVTLFTLDQAAAHFNLGGDVLARMFHSSWGRHLGNPDEILAAPAAAEAPAAVASGVREASLQVLKRNRYPALAAEHFDYFIRVC